MKLLIIGGPRTGKTTYAKELSERTKIKLYSTDDLIKFGWSEASNIVADNWMMEDGPWIIEGVASVRALRKWLERNKGPIDFKIFFMKHPKVDQLSPGQQTMTKSIKTILDEIMPEIRRRGGEIEEEKK